MKVALLTSGGDCQGLNACLRGVAKTLYHLVPDVEIYGIEDGYFGLTMGQWRKMSPHEFSGILRQGGTILGTSRQPGKYLHSGGEEINRMEKMVGNYKKAGFDAVVILGGDGTHKGAYELSKAGVNVITMPKTIDNDLWGTDFTFGFDSAVFKATDVIDSIHTTAAAHSRVFIIELMGRDGGWIALYAGIAGGADVILLPEIPYDVEKVIELINKRHAAGKNYSIVVIAEGAVSKEEAQLSPEYIKKLGPTSMRLEAVLNERLDQSVRVAIPGHFQRGGDPTPSDRILCSRMGAKVGEMIVQGDFGKMVAICNGKMTGVPLQEVVGKQKAVPADSEIIHQARLLGVSFGD